jgi:hypothetical protein
MKFPSIRQTAAQNPTIQDLIECVEILTGRRRNREIDYGIIDGVRTKALDIVHLCNMGRIKARAYLNAAQSIAGSTTEKILIDTISFDTEGVVDIANSRIIPNLAGYYQVSGNARFTIPYGEHFFCSIFKNGERVSAGAYFRSGSTGQGISTVSDLVYMNGTTDYLELYIWNSYSSALPLVVGESFQNYISVVGPF